MTARLRVLSAVLVVADVARSLDFYVGTLGCTECFRVGDPPDYAAVEREALVLNLMPASRAPSAHGQAHLHVMVTGLDALHAELVARGCAMEVPPTEFWYGLREFSLRDPDGNRITFGEEVAPQTSPS
jgi:catechol 2,3-dioxygenase-like lactoylglutathione lyase family enzyme